MNHPLEKTSEKSTHAVILFYRYVIINDPEILKEKQRALCNSLDLTGRIIIAREGINGTLEGTAENIERYIESISLDDRLRVMPIKRSEGTGSAFPRLSIKIKPEIVSLHLEDEDINPQVITGDRLLPDTLQEWLDNNEDIEIIDMRNDYEHSVGHFSRSHLLPMKHFRELPRMMKYIFPLKNKKIVTVCTGGVRCEKASGYLKKNGFNNVYQLDGGIHTYIEKYPNQHFKGKLYVFDQRITMRFETDSPTHRIVGECYVCKTPCDTYTDCNNLACHHHYICCDQCKKLTNNTCSKKCKIIQHFTHSSFKPFKKLAKTLS